MKINVRWFLESPQNNVDTMVSLIYDKDCNIVFHHFHRTASSDIEKVWKYELGLSFLVYQEYALIEVGIR